jgi:hypothetical protein
MNPKPLANRQLPHEEAIRRFLERLKADPQPKQHQPEICRPTTDLVTQEAAEDLARWFEQ